MTGWAADDRRSVELGTRLAAVRERLAAACAEAGRGPDEVELVVVTKFHPAEDVARLTNLGVRRVGENRVQEAEAKRARVAELAPGAELAWDLLGHVQSKKATGVPRWADRVQSVDSERVAAGLGRGRLREVADGRVDGDLPVLVQLSLDGDPDRGGVPLDAASALADTVAATDGLALQGVMAVPPLEGQARGHLERAAQAWREIRAEHPGAVVFSAGMSGDLHDAVLAGSTCVRVGTAILGARPIA